MSKRLMEYADDLKPLTDEIDPDAEFKRCWPDLPSWIFEMYTPKQWMWLPESERRAILNGNNNREVSWYED